MSQKLILIFAGIIFLSGFNVANADAVINEVMYSPASKQWIEIYNDGGEAIDLTQYKILDAGAEKNGHGISLCSGLLSPGSYAVIAKAPENFSNPDFTLCKSPLGIKSSTGDTVILKNGSNIIDTVAIPEGSAGSGNSLQLIGGSWASRTPTPGGVNSASALSADSDSDNEDGTSDELSAKPKPKISEAPAMKAKIIANNLAFAGAPVFMQTEVSGFSNEKVVLGKAYWNFGDGGSLEQKNNFEKFSHIYYYPGEYAVFLEYYEDNFSQIPDATNSVTIKVVPVAVVISKVGDAKDFFVELSNNADYDIDVSNWFINANGKIFVLPKNSLIMSKKSIIISGRITGFAHGDRSSLKLFSGTGEMVSDYSASVFVPAAPISTKISAVQPQIPATAPIQTTDLSSEILPQEIPVENLTALVAETDVTANNPIRAYILSTLLTVFLGIGAGAVYFIRQKKVAFRAGDDFKILDE